MHQIDEILSALPQDEQPATVTYSGNGRSYEPFDMAGFLQRHGVRVRDTKHDGAHGTKYILDECPFDSSHKAPDSFVAVMPSGALCFKCSHNSCASNKWQQFRERFEPGYRDRPRQQQTSVAAARQEAVSDPITYECITAAQLDAGDYRTEFLIQGTMIAGQPLIVAGGKKCLKTNILLDAAISLATATPMLGTLEVTRSCRVLVMSGESGLATIQETCRRICRSKAVGDPARPLVLAEVPGLIFSPDLPRIGDIRYLDALEQLIVSERIDVLIVDPAYLCMDMDGREGSLFASGAQLQGLSKVCERNGVTLALCHHTKKGVVDPFAPPELEHIAWSGFQEFARQWWLLGRREAFDPESDGEHQLWLNTGGSAGFASLWAVDITEGKYPAPRRWEATLSHASDAREQAVEKAEKTKAETKSKKHTAAVEAAKERIADALRGVEGHADTKRGIRERAGLRSGVVFDEAVGYLIRVKKLELCEIERENGHKYEGLRYAFDT